MIYCDMVISGPAHDKISPQIEPVSVYLFDIFINGTKLLGVTKPSSSAFIFKEHYLLHDINGLYLSKPFFRKGEAIYVFQIHAQLTTTYFYQILNTSLIHFNIVLKKPS